MHASPSNQPAIHCRGVTKEYGAGNALVRALRGVDLELWPGELSLLVGPSGCGKTTLLSVIAGILDQTAGDVAVLGTDLGRLSNRQKVRFRGRHIGFVFQQFNLLPALTAAENVSVPLVLQGWGKRKAVERACRMLHSMGMGDRLESLPGKLSGGQQQRVAIARALVHEPQIVVCDEPTSALDAKTGHVIMRLLRSVAMERERAVIVVTHDARVFEFGDRIASMEDGQIVEVKQQTPDDRAATATDERATLPLKTA
ncbi:MAG TPA: ABC transporter ATP-binding protein [Pirellulales bacterium]|jgi:putative ABC transport system ATP-binding protein|nr:ABC transporter ATP-binding protein [Pirellulales bacterium]